jgi:hypothetical protein
MRRAERNVLVIKLVFLGIFAVITAGLWWYHLNVVEPRAACLSRPGGEWFEKTRLCRVTPQSACEANGGWWEPQSKTCARVVYVPNITGKRP